MVLFINNGWYLPALSGGDVHVMEVASRWGEAREVAIAMPDWAYQLHSSRLTNVRQISTGGRLDRRPPRSFGALCLRYVVRSVSSCTLNADLVVAGSHYPYDLIPAFVISVIRRRPLVVYVFHLSSTFRHRGLRARLVGLWEYFATFLLRGASLVLVDNTDVERSLSEEHVAASRIQITWNASSMGMVARTDERRRDEVVFLGRISDTKGWKDLITVAERLRDACPGVLLRVLGEGERRTDLEREATKRGLGEVIRTEGFVSEEVKWSALHRAAAFVAPSSEEGWGIAVSEAIEAGAEVVCYDLPVYREVHAQAHLHFIPLGDVDRFADCVVELVQGLSTASVASSRASSRLESPTKTWGDVAKHELELVDTLHLSSRRDPH